MEKDRLSSVFNNKKTKNRPSFISYITGGDPDCESSLLVIDTLVQSGIDVLEIGIPFSDPLADGEANQLAAQRALKAGMTTEKIIELISNIRKKYEQLPIVVYSYLNPIAFAYEFNDFCRKIKEAGADALLVLDLIPEEGQEYKKIIENNGLGIVSLVTPNTEEERAKKLTDFASSFIYYVSREGVTGERTSFAGNVKNKVSALREYTEIPIVVGFGISTPAHVKEASETGVNGIVVGSAIVRKVQGIAENKNSFKDLENFVKSLVESITD